MKECKELADKVVRKATLFEEGDYGPEVNIEFTDGSSFNVCLNASLKTQVEAKLILDEGGEPRVLQDYSTPAVGL
jgi:hypothetical protein